MATKKQKHAAALAKREAYLEQERLDGLKARAAAKEKEAAQAARIAEWAEGVKQRNREIIESGIAELGEDNPMVIAYRKEIRQIGEELGDKPPVKKKPIEDLTVGEFFAQVRQIEKAAFNYNPPRPGPLAAINQVKAASDRKKLAL